jgi:hypothetical protein
MTESELREIVHEEVVAAMRGVGDEVDRLLAFLRAFDQPVEPRPPLGLVVGERPPLEL